MTDSYSDGSHSAGDMAAQDTTPWIGVHVLTECMFCPRAGVIAFEQKRIDSGEDIDGAPRLDYLPDFQIELIETALQKTWSGIWALLTWTPPVVLITGIAGLLVDWRIWLILIPLGLWLLRTLFSRFRDVLKLSARRRAAQAATPQEPDPDSTQSQPVNWWSLLKCGFTPVEYEDAHEDASWHLAGRPWRVLHKGSQRIPVFRKRCGEPKVYPQHVARLAAYCHVVEESEGGSAPYGVILFGNGYDGVTVPNSAENQQAFRNELMRARRLLQAVQKEGLMPDVPTRSTVCHDCWLGRPRMHRKGITDTHLDGQQLPAHRTRGEDQRIYHSICGDRFRWVPPHDRAAAKGLC